MDDLTEPSPETDTEADADPTPPMSWAERLEVLRTSLERVYLKPWHLVAGLIFVIVMTVNGVQASWSAREISSTTPTTAFRPGYLQFDSRNECMQASWTTVSGCNEFFPTGSGSTYTPAPRPSTPSYSTTDADELLRRSCGFLRDVGPTGDYQTDQLRSATLNNIC